MSSINHNLIQKAKSMLPNMPEEVFSTWLLPIIKDHNSWPYDNAFSPHPSDQWCQYFGLYAISDISNCLWQRMDLTFDMSCLDQLSNDTIKILIENHVYNFDVTGKFNVRDSKKRFIGLVEFIKRTKIIPAPIIGLNTNDGLRVLDGSHRLSALTYIGLRGRISCETWVASSNIE